MSSLMIVLAGLGAVVFGAQQSGSVIKLPRPERSGTVSVERAVQARRSVREFSRNPIPLAAAGQLLWAAQGVTSADGRRAAPSAGALYPLELLLVASHVDGLMPGVYRYVPGNHSIRQVVAGTRADALARAAAGQEWIADAAAVVVVAAVESRTSVKYGKRAARYVAFEAGCASENLLLEAVALGLGGVVVGAFDDREIAELVRLGRGEAPIALLPVGIPFASRGR